MEQSRHVDFLRFLSRTYFSFYERRHKSGKVFERAKNPLLRVLTKHFKILQVHSFSLHQHLNKWVILSDKFSSFQIFFKNANAQLGQLGTEIFEICEKIMTANIGQV